MRITKIKKTLYGVFFIYIPRNYLFYKHTLSNSKGDKQMEHPVARELRFIRVCLIILIIVIAFWDREKTVEITDHGSDPILNTSNMTQVGENTFAYKDESNQIKIFKFNPDTNEIKLIKEFYANEY